MAMTGGLVPLTIFRTSMSFIRPGAEWPADDELDVHATAAANLGWPGGVADRKVVFIPPEQ